MDQLPLEVSESAVMAALPSAPMAANIRSPLVIDPEVMLGVVDEPVVEPPAMNTAPNPLAAVISVIVHDRATVVLPPKEMVMELLVKTALRNRQVMIRKQCPALAFPGSLRGF